MAEDKKMYWETETPKESKTPRNILKYFKEAQKLQVSMNDWVDGEGNSRKGKTVTLDLKSLTKDAKDILAEIATR